MHEQDFRILEGQDITLPELGRELENITGHTIADSTGEIKRVIAHYQTLSPIQILLLLHIV